MAVKPTRSTNTTLTILRSSSTPGRASSVPQAVQKATPAGSGPAPQDGQIDPQRHAAASAECRLSVVQDAACWTVHAQTGPPYRFDPIRCDNADPDRREIPILMLPLRALLQAARAAPGRADRVDSAAIGHGSRSNVQRRCALLTSQTPSSGDVGGPARDRDESLPDGDAPPHGYRCARSGSVMFGVGLRRRASLRYGAGIVAARCGSLHDCLPCAGHGRAWPVVTVRPAAASSRRAW